MLRNVLPQLPVYAPRRFRLRSTELHVLTVKYLYKTSDLINGDVPAYFLNSRVGTFPNDPERTDLYHVLTHLTRFYYTN